MTGDKTIRGEGGMQSGSAGRPCGSREGFALARVEARRSDAFPRNASPSRKTPWWPAPSGVHLRRMAQRVLRGESSVELSSDSLEINLTSRGAGASGRRGGSVRKNIIGREMAPGIFLLRKNLFRGGLFRSGRWPLPLVHQQSREHGASGFVDPLIEQGANLLAEIGGMTKTGEFVALQRIARSREKKLPGW
jgi:hypothetical protein